MATTTFEELARFEARESDRTMVFAALRCRSGVGPRGLLAALLRLLGANR